MFSSLASFLFGSSTSCESNNYIELEKEQNENLPSGIQSEAHSDTYLTTDENGKFTSQVTTANLESEFQQGRKKSKRNNRKNKNEKELLRVSEHGKYESPGHEIDFLNENDWFFVREEDLHDQQAVEENLDLDANLNRASTPVLEVCKAPKPEVKTIKYQKIKKESQQIRKCNRQKRNRNTKTSGSNARPFSINGCNKVCTSSLSPSKSFPREWGANGTVDSKALADVDISQSLYVVSDRQESGHNVSGASCDSNSSGAKLFTMVDSWYLTPPPCFTSNGPINMEISPLENLLIEHPSMSVYHSIRSSENATESFVNFDLEINEPKKIQMKHPNTQVSSNGQQKKHEKENDRPKQKSVTTKPFTTSVDQNTHIPVESRTAGPRIDRYTAAQLKMQLFAWNGQKSQANVTNQNLCRGAILRSNKVRDIQSKGNRQRRADMQHSRLNSGVNNNRKCCY